jgi:hypothetical protein
MLTIIARLSNADSIAVKMTAPSPITGIEAAKIIIDTGDKAADAIEDCNLISFKILRAAMFVRSSIFVTFSLMLSTKLILKSPKQELVCSIPLDPSIIKLIFSPKLFLFQNSVTLIRQKRNLY